MRINRHDGLAVGVDPGRHQADRAESLHIGAKRRQRQMGIAGGDAQVRTDGSPGIVRFRGVVGRGEGQNLHAKRHGKRAGDQGATGMGRPAPQPAQGSVGPRGQRAINPGPSCQHQQGQARRQEGAADPQGKRGQQHIEGQHQRGAFDRAALQAACEDIDAEDGQTDGNEHQIKPRPAPRRVPAKAEQPTLCRNVAASGAQQSDHANRPGDCACRDCDPGGQQEIAGWHALPCRPTGRRTDRQQRDYQPESRTGQPRQGRLRHHQQRKLALACAAHPQQSLVAPVGFGQRRRRRQAKPGCHQKAGDAQQQKQHLGVDRIVMAFQQGFGRVVGDHQR